MPRQPPCDRRTPRAGMAWAPLQRRRGLAPCQRLKFGGLVAIASVLVALGFMVSINSLWTKIQSKFKVACAAWSERNARGDCGQPARRGAKFFLQVVSPHFAQRRRLCPAGLRSDTGSEAPPGAQHLLKCSQVHSHHPADGVAAHRAPAPWALSHASGAVRVSTRVDAAIHVTFATDRASVPVACH